LRFIRTRMDYCVRLASANVEPLQFLRESWWQSFRDGFMKNNSAAAADESVDGSSLSEKNSPL
jgi:hypothetical protein